MISSETEKSCASSSLIKCGRKQLLARDSVLQKERRKFLVSCAKFCGASLLVQSIENEIFQLQTCQPNLQYDGTCVVTNQHLSDIILSSCNILKAVNAFLSCAAGVCISFIFYVLPVFTCIRLDQVPKLSMSLLLWSKNKTGPHYPRSLFLPKISLRLSLFAAGSPEFVGGATCGCLQACVLRSRWCNDLRVVRAAVQRIQFIDYWRLSR